MESPRTSNLRLIVKKLAQSVALVLVLPSALLCGFGKWRELYTVFAHIHALFPGIIGNLFRAGYYRLTLRDCSINVNIGFGTFIVHPGTTVGRMTTIGSYCVVGRATIGPRTLIASHVEILSNRHQHLRGEDGRLSGTIDGETVIGADCWIGASAVVMATVGDGSTIGAGAVVVRDIPPGAVAVGNPARVIRLHSTTV